MRRYKDLPAMHLTIEVEITKRPETDAEGYELMPGYDVTSVFCNGTEIEKQVDSVGRAGGSFWALRVPEDDQLVLDLVQWEV